MKPDSVAVGILGVAFRATFVIVAVCVIYYGASTCYDYGYRIFEEPAVSSGEGRTVTVTVQADMSPLDMGKLMLSKGLIRDDKLFALQYYASEYRKDLKPGTFELSTAMTAEEMFQFMANQAKEEEAAKKEAAEKNETGEKEENP